MAQWVECSPMVRKTRVQSQVESYQRLQKWHLIPPCLTLSYIRYVSRVKWSNPGKGVAPFPTPRCSSYWKGSLLVTLDYDCQLIFWWLYIYSITISDLWMITCSLLFFWLFLCFVLFLSLVTWSEIHIEWLQFHFCERPLILLIKTFWSLCHCFNPLNLCLLDPQII